MADILTPTLGESVSEATVARWTKKAGEAVKKDEILVELETDKVSLEVACSPRSPLRKAPTWSRAKSSAW
jgi:pyruvate/2-oxoglutarate dehydrogenase complex dihydrolipoamide acyltransferase (E2) component